MKTATIGLFVLLTASPLLAEEMPKANSANDDASFSVTPAPISNPLYMGHVAGDSC